MMSDCGSGKHDVSQSVYETAGSGVRTENEVGRADGHVRSTWHFTLVGDPGNPFSTHKGHYSGDAFSVVGVLCDGGKSARGRGDITAWYRGELGDSC